MGIDEMGVDEMGSRRSGNKPICGPRPTHYNRTDLYFPLLFLSEN